MKAQKIFIYFLIAASFLLIIVASFLMLTACGGGGGSSAGTGELAIDITDAKPLLPEGVTNLWVEIAEVLVHGQGGWESLPMPQTPYTIDLLQFHGNEADDTTELIPPVMLRSGKYTQIRLVLAEGGANISFDNGATSIPVVIPSENLKTDKNIDFDVPSGGSVDLMMDFDLSQSLVVTDDGSGTLSYKCQPVLHIVKTFEAATISGTIAGTSFSTNTANITVLANGEVYTEVTVDKDEPNFTIFWLVPNKDYRVEINFDYALRAATNSPDWCENVNGTDLQPGADFLLNGDEAITPTSNCSS